MVLVPNDLTEEENRISIVANSTAGLGIQFQLTKNTTSEIINIIIKQVSKSILTEEGWQIGGGGAMGKDHTFFSLKNQLLKLVFNFET